MPLVGGICECGCRQVTRIVDRTCATKGWVKGQPLRFAGPGHNAKVTNHPYRSIKDSDYRIEERGYETPCWIWTHHVSRRAGHALVMIDKRRIPAHVASYQQFIGPVPHGRHLHHLCLQPSCVNPWHLNPVTPGDHVRIHAAIRRAIRESATA